MSIVQLNWLTSKRQKARCDVLQNTPPSGIADTATAVVLAWTEIYILLNKNNTVTKKKLYKNNIATK